MGVSLKPKTSFDKTTFQVVHEAVAQATQRIEQVELDLNDQGHQARRCIQELTEKWDNFEAQMARTAGVNKQLLSRVLFLEEKVSVLVHQTGTLHAPPPPCTVGVRGGQLEPRPPME